MYMSISRLASQTPVHSRSYLNCSLPPFTETVSWMFCAFMEAFLSELRSIAIDALIVGAHTQQQYLAKKKTWTRKMVLLTDGDSPMELEDWELTAKKLNEYNVHLTIM